MTDQSRYQLTIMGYGLMLKQLSDKNAFLFFSSIFPKLSGSASTSSPLQLRLRSKNKVFDRVSPSNAPHSTKNPSFCKYTQFKLQSNCFKALYQPLSYTQNKSTLLSHTNQCALFDVNIVVLLHKVLHYRNTAVSQLTGMEALQLIHTHKVRNML
jgi:hypothetical protein